MGEGLIIDGRRVPVPGVNVIAWADDARDRVDAVVHGRERPAADALAIVMHSSRGRRSVVRPGSRPSEKGNDLARYNARRKEKQTSWHLTGDTDGEVFQQADLATFRTNHVGVANSWTIGYELAQHRDNTDLWRVQIDAAVAVVSATCAALSIPRRVFVGPDGAPWLKPVPLVLAKEYDGQGQRWGGVLGHCQLVTPEHRGPGDPGDGIFLALLAAGFEGVRVAGVAAAPAPVVASSAAPPPWLDGPELDATRDIAVTPEAFARNAWEILRALNVPRDAAVEIIAHCANECSWGTRAIGGNVAGIKAKRRDADAYRAKHGRSFAWWRAAGHKASGDDDVEWYRGLDDVADCLRFVLKRYAPKPDTEAESERYEDAGEALWSDDPRQWFVELLLAGYRGETREAEVEALLAAGRSAEEHKSVKRHREIAARVRGMLA